RARRGLGARFGAPQCTVCAFRSPRVGGRGGLGRTWGRAAGGGARGGLGRTWGRAAGGGAQGGAGRLAGDGVGCGRGAILSRAATGEVRVRGGAGGESGDSGAR